MDAAARRKRRRRLGRVIGLVIGVVLGWWAGAKLTGGPVLEPTTAPASRDDASNVSPAVAGEASPQRSMSGAAGGGA